MGFGFVVGCGAGWPTCASTGSGGCKLGWASRPPCRRPTASGTIRLCFKRLSAAGSTWWRAGSGEWAERAPAPARYRCPLGCSPTTWPGGAAWCRAALGRGLVVVWLYERPGLAFPYPLRVHRVRCLPTAWLHSSVATSKPLLLARSLIVTAWGEHASNGAVHLLEPCRPRTRPLS